jgi:hypothetical protein
MKKIILKAGHLAVVGTVILSGQAKSESPSIAPVDRSQVQTMVETLDVALGLDMAEGHESRSTLARIEAEMKRLQEICAKIEATEEQKITIRDEVFAFKEKTLPLETNLKLARLKYVQTALSANGLEADASARVTDAVSAVTAIAQAKGELVTKILFQNLKPEQRKPALVCLAAMKICEHEHAEAAHSMD